MNPLVYLLIVFINNIERDIKSRQDIRDTIDINKGYIKAISYIGIIAN